MNKNVMAERFRVEFMEEAADFLGNLPIKTREKVLFNIWKARNSNDRELFKKLNDDVWEFRTLYQKTYIRFFAFWDKHDSFDTVVISTHGIIKKTGKLPKSEIERAEKLRLRYFDDKKRNKS
ncbi:type II toxin-antitoxin system RelE/ParE family toxin [uncultured Imperialibacter sp.]|uniref:type II toxin-antitoxin system RelE/ParE family toxin n=1 Tax=uncultured Imperialibacter sp. TaxID=1672639 RepID=UPI0030DA7B3E